MGGLWVWWGNLLSFRGFFQNNQSMAAAKAAQAQLHPFAALPSPLLITIIKLTSVNLSSLLSGIIHWAMFAGFVTHEMQSQATFTNQTFFVEELPSVHSLLLDLENINLYIGAPRSRTCSSQSDRTPNGFSLSQYLPLIFKSSWLLKRTSLPLPYLRNCSFILTATASTSDWRNTWLTGESSWVPYNVISGRNEKLITSKTQTSFFVKENARFSHQHPKWKHHSSRDHSQERIQGFQKTSSGRDWFTFPLDARRSAIASTNDLWINLRLCPGLLKSGFGH